VAGLCLDLLGSLPRSPKPLPELRGREGSEKGGGKGWERWRGKKERGGPPNV